MFTPFMTDEELQTAAFQDFQEMRVKVRCACEKFVANLRVKPGERRLIHSLVEKKTYRTRSQNDWHIIFRSNGMSAGGRVTGECLMYIPLYRSNNQVDYLFIGHPERYQLERVSAHFLQRYKERYLESNHIDLHGMNPGVYYMFNNNDRTQAYYIPEKWTEEELKEKCFLISSQGLSLVTLHDKMIVYITFLDQENLSRYKALVYEEEEFVKNMNGLTKLKDEEMRNMFKKLCGNPQSKEILRRILLRNGRKRENIEAEVDDFIKGWEHVLEVGGRYIEDYERAKQDVKKKYAAKSMLDIVQNEIRWTK